MIFEVLISSDSDIFQTEFKMYLYKNLASSYSFQSTFLTPYCSLVINTQVIHYNLQKLANNSLNFSIVISFLVKSTNPFDITTMVHISIKSKWQIKWRNHILLEVSRLSFSKSNSFPMDIKMCMLNLSLHEIEEDSASIWIILFVLRFPSHGF